MKLSLVELEEYLVNRHQMAVHIQDVKQLGGKETGASALKQFGYGQPLLVTYRVAGEEKQEVLHRIRRTAFGRERDDDRIAAVWLDYHTFNRLPRHVRAVDMLIRTQEGTLQSIRAADDLLLMTTFQPGHLYADDLSRIRDEGAAQPFDFQRAKVLAVYLAGIHQVQQQDGTLWRRRLRDLIGHGEGIMGLTDSYPADLAYAPAAQLRAIEEAANAWRWKLKPLDQRLSQVHGDFHPFNIVFTENGELFVLDRSRGEWGEPADDISCLTINYLFFSLQRTGTWERPFRDLHDQFWEHYLAARPDEMLTAAIQPWFAWRALVLASPLWYPTLSDCLRQQLITFARRVLATDRFDFQQIEQYLEPLS